ncbi:hypothetical protein [Bradyrhizobium ottawaense]|uniref:Uncharacterized protein n=1 Tax=Bradyrhizobium ottawaense TaxID=931866 RepID=A0ABV4G2D7_9BRAD
MTPKRKEIERDQQWDEPKAEMSVIDPDFDDPDQADAEFTAWRWPDRERSE